MPHFLDPKSHQVNRKQFAKLLTFMDWITQCQLPQKIKDDAMRVLWLMCWMIVNERKIQDFVDKGRYDELSPRDQALGVLRDHNGTSVHFNSYRWPTLITLEADPIVHFARYRDHVHEHAYAFFNNQCYWISNGQIETLDVKPPHIDRLTQLFPKAQSTSLEGTQEAIQTIQECTGHILPKTPGQRAVEDFKQIVQAFENTSHHLLKTNNQLALLMLTAKLNYDKDIGCFEARVADAMSFAGKIASEDSYTPTLEDLLHICQITHFSDLVDPTYNLVMAFKFFTPYYGQLVSYNGEKEKLDKNLVCTAITKLLDYPYDEEAIELEMAEEERNPAQWKAKWHVQMINNLMRNARRTLGQLGMIQYRFQNPSLAFQLAELLHEYPPLQSLGIQRCKPELDSQINPAEYVVRLTDKQESSLTPTPASSPPTQSTNSAPIAAQSLSKGAAALQKTKQFLSKIFFDPTLYRKLIEMIPPPDKNPDLTQEQFNAAKFRGLIQQASKPEIDELLQVVTQGHLFNRLFTLAQRRNNYQILWPLLQTLIDKASTGALGKALSIFDPIYHSIALDTAAQIPSKGLFEYLMRKMSQTDLDTALSERPRLLHSVMRNQPPHIIREFIDKVSRESLNLGLLSDKTIKHGLLSHNNDTDYLNGLYIACGLEESTLRALIEKAGEAVLTQAVQGHQRHGISCLLRVSTNYPRDMSDPNKPSVLLSLLRKIQPTALRTMPSMDYNLNNLLSDVLSRHDTETVEKVIELSTPTIMHEAMTCSEKFAEELWFTAAKRPDADAIFPALLHKMSPFTKTIGDIASFRSSKYYFLSLLQLIITEKGIHHPISQELIKTSSPTALYQALFDEKNVDPASWAIAAIDAITNIDELKGYIDLIFILSNIPLPKDKIDDLETINDQFQRVKDPNTKQLASKIIQRWHQLSAANAPVEALIHLGNGNRVSLSAIEGSNEGIQSLAEMIEKSGLASWSDFHTLVQYFTVPPFSHPLHRVLSLIKRYDTLTPQSLPPSILKIYEELKSGALIKMIMPWQTDDVWERVLRSLENPQNRSSLRKEVREKGPMKFYHLENTIREYHKESQTPPPNRHSTHGKKTSTSYIGPELDTTPFQHEKKLSPVGLLISMDPNLERSHYNEQRAKVRAFLTGDQGTFNRQWVGTLEQVEAYAKRAERFNYPSLKAFRAALEKSPRKKNEVLAEIPRGAVMSVVICRKDRATRKIAATYQQDLRCRLGINVPISYYDPILREFIGNLRLHEALLEVKALELEQKNCPPPHPSGSRFRFFTEPHKSRKIEHRLVRLKKIIADETAVSPAQKTAAESSSAMAKGP